MAEGDHSDWRSGSLLIIPPERLHLDLEYAFAIARHRADQKAISPHYLSLDFLRRKHMSHSLSFRNLARAIRIAHYCEENSISTSEGIERAANMETHTAARRSTRREFLAN